MQSLTCLVKKEEDQYASLCVELDIASCGSTKKESVQGLKNAIETYLEWKNRVVIIPRKIFGGIKNVG
ncbi:MAG: type II toxin-antitoxin system HicB family antitoxin [bacterium]|nr:type II toxin-antitoxin system HicB family antitoxin [bacterium]